MRKHGWPLVAAMMLVVSACSGDATSGSEQVPADGGTFDAPLTGLDIHGGETATGDVYVPKQGEFGYPCQENSDCFSGWCIAPPEGSRCTKTCLDSCPEGWNCRSLDNVDPVYLCLPRWLHICDPCATHSDCVQGDTDSGHYCLDWGAKGHFCGGECSSDGLCPSGYSCMDVPVGGGLLDKQCVPDAQECACSQLAQQLQLSSTCSVATAQGTCHGVRMCTTAGLSACNALTPQSEVCDGIDNDCNGATDDLPPDYPCQKSNEFGTCVGGASCIGGLEICHADEPEVEICDGLDNDCDGTVDEDSADTDGDGLSDCIDEDDDNDGIPDVSDNCPVVPNQEQVNTDGDLQGDECDEDDDNDSSPDVDDCAPLDATIKPGGIELCDGIDNDCDDEIDENLCDDGNPCTDDACQSDGSCAHTPNLDPCDDASVCTLTDHCQDGTCQGFDPINCNDEIDCSGDTCDPVAGCQHSSLSGPACANDPGGCAPCEDGSPCTTLDYCLKGNCMPGPQKDCTEGNPCVFSQCNPQSGCSPPQPINNACSLGNLGQCQEAKCIAGQCTAMSKDGGFCTSSSGTCPLGICAGGSCLPKAGEVCQTQIKQDLCNSVDVTGQCDGSGNCSVTQAPPGMTCPGCAGICLVCFFIQICVPFGAF